MGIAINVVNPEQDIELAVEDAVKISFDENQQCLKAEICSSSHSLELSVGQIQEKIEHLGFGHYPVDVEKLQEVVDRSNKNEECVIALFGRKPGYVKLDFKFIEEGNSLVAELSRSFEKQEINILTINQTLKNLGYDKLKFEDGALDQLLSAVSLNKCGSYPLAKKIDAVVQVFFSENELEAYVTTERAFGGLEITMERLLASIAEAGIAAPYLIESSLLSVVKEQAVSKVKIAQGIAAEDGVDGYFEALVEELCYPELEESRSGKIDLNELVQFTEVAPGDALMRYIPATSGTEGVTVRNELIPANHGEEKSFAQNLNGAELSTDDVSLLLASKKGHPVILKDGVNVEDVLILNEVNTSVGNVDFDGSVMVKGDVCAGVEINVTGDILVKGVVNNAILKAGKNIEVGAGIVGRDALDLDVNLNDSFEANIQAGETIKARYVTLSRLKAGVNIEAREYISHSICVAEESILVGNNGGKGMLFGGRLCAGNNIIANTLGTDSGIMTNIHVGCNDGLLEELSEMKSELLARNESLYKLEKILAKFIKVVRANPKDPEKVDKLRTINKTVVAGRKGVERMEAKISAVGEKIHAAKGAYVEVIKSLYPNVNVAINEHSLEIRKESRGGKFNAFGSGIRWLDA